MKPSSKTALSAALVAYIVGGAAGWGVARLEQGSDAADVPSRWVARRACMRRPITSTR